MLSTTQARRDRPCGPASTEEEKDYGEEEEDEDDHEHGPDCPCSVWMLGGMSVRACACFVFIGRMPSA